MTIRAGLLLGLLVFSACATPPPPSPPPVATPTRDDLIVLLPDQEGKTGAVSVTHAGAEQVLDTPYAAARIKEEGRVDRTPATPEEVNRVFGAALGAQPPRPKVYVLNFVFGKDELTPESQRVVQQVLDEIASRPAVEIVVIGHTDSVGSVAVNDRISLDRAKKIKEYLEGRGVSGDLIELAGRGAREPVVHTAGPEEKNRRVEISVR